MSDQWVYFIQADEGGPIKIGFTADDPKRRLSQLQTGNASTLKLLGSIKGTAARERQFHAELSEFRLQGEWFKSDPTVLAAVQNALTADDEPIVCCGVRCSFCGVCQHNTGILVAADRDGAHICEQCVGRCAKMAAEYFLSIAAAAQPPIAEVGQLG